MYSLTVEDGVGVGEGDRVGVGVGVGVGVAVGMGEGVGVGDADCVGVEVATIVVVGEGVGVCVGDGIGEGDAEGVDDCVGTGEGNLVGSVRTRTPRFHTNFLPCLMHLNSFPKEITTAPNFLQVLPGFGATALATWKFSTLIESRIKNASRRNIAPF